MRNVFIVTYLCISSAILISSCSRKISENKDVISAELQSAIIKQANLALTISPLSLTNTVCDRSAGGPNDFYSEGDYWWPDPSNPEGPYIRKDGQTNPNNFNDHRLAMWNLNESISYLTAAYLLSNDVKYAQKAQSLLTTFFLDSKTRMNPNLLYGQAIKGLHTGRGIGIIDTIHLIEVSRAIKKLFLSGGIALDTYEGLQNWFEQYASWISTHQYGKDEKYNGNNHSTWWAAQMVAFGDLSNRTDHIMEGLSYARQLLDQQLAADGSFPDEMSRTKPYSYSLFNLEAFAVIAQIDALRPVPTDFWNYESKNGTIKNALNFMRPSILDKSNWKTKPDVQHFDELPIASCGLYFAAQKYNDTDLLTKWSTLPTRLNASEEVKRTFPLINPILWQN